MQNGWLKKKLKTAEFAKNLILCMCSLAVSPSSYCMFF